MKANGVFFDAKPKVGQVHTRGVWFYDLRTNRHFTLKTRTLKLNDLQDFIRCYHPENRHERRAAERFKFFSYDDLLARDKASLDIFWLKDDGLDNLVTCRRRMCCSRTSSTTSKRPCRRSGMWRRACRASRQKSCPERADSLPPHQSAWQRAGGLTMAVHRQPGDDGGVEAGGPLQQAPPTGR